MKRIKKFLFNAIIFFRAFEDSLSQMFSSKKAIKRYAMLVEEFFHQDLGGFGGYGMSVKNVIGFLNTSNQGFNGDVLLTRIYDHTNLQVKHYHDTDVLFRPNHLNQYVLNFFRYSRLAKQRHIDFLFSCDWYASYEYCALSLPRTPLIIWIKDPRATEEWQKIASVPLEFSVIGENYKEGKIGKIVERKKSSIQRVLQFSKFYNRKVVFATQAYYLVERAKRSYGLPSINALFLPNPIKIAGVAHPHFSARPSVCLLGRLEPIKRPWIFFELAKRFPKIDFLVAGKSHFPELMEPIVRKYNHLSNLKFLGMVSGKEKHELLNNVWVLINTSIHEALPVSFLEAFSYCKPVISCQNPDDLVSRFGFNTGESLGEGLTDDTLKRFSEGIEKIVFNEENRIQKGLSAKRYVSETYSFESFVKIMKGNVSNALGMN